MSETPWAKVPRSVVERVRCDACLRLLTFLDLRQGDAGRPVRGIGEVSDVLGWQHRTAAKHAEHLAAAGLIELDPAPVGASGRRSWGNTRLRVLHNPARGRYSDRLSIVEGVWDAVPERWRPPPTPAEELDRLRTNAERAAPQPDARTAPQTSRAPRLNGPTDAERAAPSVPLSPRSEGEIFRARGEHARSAVALVAAAFDVPLCACGSGEQLDEGARYCRACEPF